MAQQYLPEITEGDKRILLVNGEAVPYCLARVPLAGESRGTLLQAGPGGFSRLLSVISGSRPVGPTLKERGLYLVGLDVIGDFLTEINVTSPTCLREIESETSLDIAGQLLDGLPVRGTYSDWLWPAHLGGFEG